MMAPYTFHFYLTVYYMQFILVFIRIRFSGKNCEKVDLIFDFLAFLIVWPIRNGEILQLNHEYSATNYIFNKFKYKFFTK